jgi:hypothetical protein
VQEYRPYLHSLAFLLVILLLIAPSRAFSDDEATVEGSIAPVPTPSESSILLAVDFLKESGNFSGASITFSLPLSGPAEPSSGDKSRDLLKETGCKNLEIRVKNNFSGILKDAQGSPEDAGTYDFSSLDALVKRAGESGLSLVITFEADTFPGDINRYMGHLEHILSHLMTGWAQGFRLSERDVSAVILDCSPEKPEGYWKGREYEYLKLYGLFAKAVKKANQKVPAGGPGFLNIFKDEDEQVYRELSPDIAVFLDYLVKSKIPLDFIYCHHRGMVPYGYFLKSRTLQEKVLSLYKSLSPLFGTPRMAWSADILPQGDEPLFRSTVMASAIFCLIKGGATLIALPVKLTESDPVLLALKGTSVYNDYPLQLETVGLDRLCFILMAAKSKDGRKMVLAISGNNPSLYFLEGHKGPEALEMEKEYRGFVDTFTEKIFPPIYSRYHLSIQNLDWSGGEVSYRRIVIDGHNSLKNVEEKTLKGMKELYFNDMIKIPALHLIFLEVAKKSEEDKAKQSGK